MGSADYALSSNDAFFDNTTAASEVWLVGNPLATMRPTSIEQLQIVKVAYGAPRVHISKVRLLGQLRVDGGELNIQDCIIEEISSTSVVGGKLSAKERALTVFDGRVILMRTVMQGHSAGAIYVASATLILIETTIRKCQAPAGGAILVCGHSTVQVELSQFVDNSAAVSGGALQVNGGNVILHNQTLFDHNSAPDGTGSSILLTNGTLTYTLPAPPGRWLSIRQGVTFSMDPGAEESSTFPFLCPAGVVGGTSTQEQSGPGCSRPW
eukprot:7389207-Prymnesium_polylepis.1